MTFPGGHVFPGPHVLMVPSGQSPSFAWFLDLALCLLSSLPRLMHGFVLRPPPPPPAHHGAGCSTPTPQKHFPETLFHLAKLSPCHSCWLCRDSKASNLAAALPWPHSLLPVDRGSAGDSTLLTVRVPVLCWRGGRENGLFSLVSSVWGPPAGCYQGSSCNG